MKKTLLLALLVGTTASVAWADNVSASQPTTTPKVHRPDYDRNSSVHTNQVNSPNVNSRLYSGAQFPQQNNITGEKGAKYNANSKGKTTTDNSKFDQNNATEADQSNSPNVNSRLYSGAQFPQQNAITGTKNTKYHASAPKRQKVNNKDQFDSNNATKANQLNSPNVNSRLYSGSQFPQQNNITGKKLTSSAAH